MTAVDTAGIRDFAQSGLATEEGIQNVFTMMRAKSGQAFGQKDWTELDQQVQLTVITVKFSFKYDDSLLFSFITVRRAIEQNASVFYIFEIQTKTNKQL